MPRCPYEPSSIMDDCKVKGLTRLLESTHAAKPGCWSPPAWPCWLIPPCILLQERAAAARSLEPQPPPASTNGATDSSAGPAADSAVLSDNGASGLVAQRRGPVPSAAGSMSGQHSLGPPATAALQARPSVGTALLPDAEVSSVAVTAQR